MRITSIADLLRQQPLLRDLDPADVELLAGCGRNEVFPAGAVIARETEMADRFYVVRAGRVALELPAPTGPLVIETLGPGDLVGWSWIFPPYRWTCDVEALDLTKVVAIDGACLRARCERDPAFGYRMMQRFAQSGRPAPPRDPPAPARPLRHARCPLRPRLAWRRRSPSAVGRWCRRATGSRIASSRPATRSRSTSSRATSRSPRRSRASS